MSNGLLLFRWCGIPRRLWRSSNMGPKRRGSTVSTPSPAPRPRLLGFLPLPYARASLTAAREVHHSLPPGRVCQLHTFLVCYNAAQQGSPSSGLRHIRMLLAHVIHHPSAPQACPAVLPPRMIIARAKRASHGHIRAMTPRRADAHLHKVLALIRHARDNHP